MVSKKLTNLFTLMLVCSLVLISTNSCQSVRVTFNGANIPPEAKTISIQNFFDDAGTGPASLSINFSEKMREYFLRNTSLSLVPANGDLQFEGRISGYTVAPVATTGEQIAGLQRLTITVSATYACTVDDTNDFEKEFSFYADFDATKNVTEVENDLIPIIINQIVIDIFNASVATW